MTFKTKMKIVHTGTDTKIMVLVNHPMEPGNRINKETGKPVPAHYIESMHFLQNNKTVADVSLGPGTAANPMTILMLRNIKAGDQIFVRWKDNRGMQGKASQQVH